MQALSMHIIRMHDLTLLFDKNARSQKTASCNFFDTCSMNVCLVKLHVLKMSFRSMLDKYINS